MFPVHFSLRGFVKDMKPLRTLKQQRVFPEKNAVMNTYTYGSGACGPPKPTHRFRKVPWALASVTQVSRTHPGSGVRRLGDKPGSVLGRWPASYKAAKCPCQGHCESVTVLHRALLGGRGDSNLQNWPKPGAGVFSVRLGPLVSPST